MRSFQMRLGEAFVTHDGNFGGRRYDRIAHQAVSDLSLPHFAG